jgi:hypothetical protein
MRTIKLMTVLLLVLAACGDDATTSAAPSGSLITGESNVIAALEAGCADGDFVMCDVLFFAAPFDSELEAFADTCGNRNEGGLYCAEAYDVDIDAGELTTQCRDGVMIACDQLFMYSPDESAAEEIGRSCGGLGRESRTCVVDHGLLPR